MGESVVFDGVYHVASHVEHINPQASGSSCIVQRNMNHAKFLKEK